MSEKKDALGDLAGQKCLPCSGGEPQATSAEIEKLREQVPDWELIQVEGVRRLRRTFSFRDFASAMEFARQVGAAAESQGHHPRVTFEWGRTTVTWWTHKIGGLHHNDFIMAARTDRIFRETGGSG